MKAYLEEDEPKMELYRGKPIFSAPHGAWMYGSLLTLKFSPDGESHSYIIPEDASELRLNPKELLFGKQKFSLAGALRELEVDPDTVCRQVGHTPDGKTLFEKDIIHVVCPPDEPPVIPDDYYDEFCEIISVSPICMREKNFVIFCTEPFLSYDNNCDLGDVGPLLNNESWEIVGNTIDNPDLVKKVREEK